MVRFPDIGRLTLIGNIALFASSVVLSFVSPRIATYCWYVGLMAPLLEFWLAKKLKAHQDAEAAAA